LIVVPKRIIQANERCKQIQKKTIVEEQRVLFVVKKLMEECSKIDHKLVINYFGPNIDLKLVETRICNFYLTIEN
jgi:hypothetical protein